MPSAPLTVLRYPYDPDRPCPSSPTCAELLAPGSVVLPDHVCFEAAIRSVASFARQKFPAITYLYHCFWPLPISADTIRESSESRRIAWNPSKPRRLPEPLTDRPGSWAGLAVSRTIETGTVLLLGLVGPAAIEEGEWQFLEPIIQSQSWAKSNAERLALLAEEKRLWDWYSKCLRGTRLTGGRPAGTTETFRDRDHFRSSLSVAIRAIKQQGRHPSAERVAEYLRANPGLTGGERYFLQEGYDVRRLRRYQRRYGYGHWSEVLKDLS